MKTGVIDVGGGFRGIFGAGVLDACIDKGIRFDYCIGVSAGSANLASFLGGQRGRNIKFYTEYGFRREYASWHNFVRKKSFIDMDYVYGTLSNHDGEYPLDCAKILANPAQFTIVACNALTGETVYLPKSCISPDHYEAFKASSAIPFVCHPYKVDGVPCFDGGIGDPVPVARAFADGCDRVVLILTKPRDAVRVQKKDRFPARQLARSYPAAAEQLLARYQKYNDGVALAKRYEAEGRLLIVAPDDCCGMTTLHRTQESLMQMYDKGVRGAETIAPFLSAAAASAPR